MPVRPAPKLRAACGSGRRTTLVAYLFLLPALALLAIFTFYPVIFGTVLSLFEYDVINPPRYVGLQQRSEEHTSELQSLAYLVCRLLLEKKKKKKTRMIKSLK